MSNHTSVQIMTDNNVTIYVNFDPDSHLALLKMQQEVAPGKYEYDTHNLSMGTVRDLRKALAVIEEAHIQEEASNGYAR